MRSLAFITLAISACVQVGEPVKSMPEMYVVDEKDVVREEAPPHGAIGTSTAFRISDAAPDRTMEFRRRILHPGAAVGLHVISHDEVYYVVSGEGAVTSDGQDQVMTAGMAAYLYQGAEVGISQVGEVPLVIIIAYPLPGHPRLKQAGK